MDRDVGLEKVSGVGVLAGLDLTQLEWLQHAQDEMMDAAVLSGEVDSEVNTARGCRIFGTALEGDSAMIHIHHKVFATALMGLLPVDR